jgi:hypothetical protein
LTDGQQPVAPRGAAGRHHTKPMRNSRRTLPAARGPPAGGPPRDTGAEFGRSAAGRAPCGTPPPI